MGYESNTGLGVSNQYGQRDSVGVKGDLPSSNYEKVFVVNLDGAGPTIKFPTPVGGVVVTNIDTTFATGTLTALTIGGVDLSDVDGTTAEYVTIAANNTGVVAQTGLTAGNLIIKYMQYIA